MIQRKLGFIGAGLMAEALLKGILDSGAAEAERLYASDPASDRIAAFRELIGENAFNDNTGLVAGCDVVVLSVKPGVVPVVAGEIASQLTPDHLVVSIAAGVDLGKLGELLGTDRLVRVMPNTPALVHAGAAAYCTGAGATAEDAELVEQMLSAVGLCVRLEEKHMDAVTGLSGSGPAYVYLAIEALSDGGVQMGLPRQAATRLAAQTVLGAAKMVLETGRHPGELKDQVTTPGGTTIEAIHALEAAGLRKAFIEAVVAASEKSRRLSGRS
ncbi:MAG: pyrroline-5-carboxylate reductase [Candidatus Brocadiia bacterium]